MMRKSSKYYPVKINLIELVINGKHWYASALVTMNLAEKAYLSDIT